MALLGSSCPLFGRSGPKVRPQNCSQKCSKSIPKFDLFFCFFQGLSCMKMMMMFIFSFGTLNGPGFLHKIRKRFTRETKMSPRGPSWALKSQTPASKKPEKTRWFLMFLGPETSQETLKKPKSRPRSTQRAPKARQKSTKKNQKTWSSGKKCLKLAISF